MGKNKCKHRWKYLGVVTYKNKVYKIHECEDCEVAQWTEVKFNYVK